MAVNQTQILRPSDFLGQGRPNMNIKHPQVLTMGRKTDYALDPSASVESRAERQARHHTHSPAGRGAAEIVGLHRPHIRALLLLIGHHLLAVRVSAAGHGG